jgi:Zn-dependent protease
VTPPAPPAAQAHSGVRVGRVLGVPVHVSPSWLLFAALVIGGFGPQLAEDYGAQRGYAAAGAFSLLVLASVLLHEIGHCVVARAFSLPVRSITVTFLAGLTEITEPPQTPAREYAVAVIGPMVSLLLASVGWASAQAFESGSLPYLLCAIVAVSNGLVAAFNLLPGLPLDGGRVLRAAVWHLTGDPDRSTVVAAWSGRAVAVLGVPLLLVVLLPAADVIDLSVTTVVFSAFISAFIYAGATVSLQRAQLVARLPALTLPGLARPALALPSDLPLSEAVRRTQEAQLRAVVLVDSRGEPEAVVSEKAVLATPDERRPWMPVSAVARRLDDGLVLDAALEGEQLLEAMRRVPATEYVVRDDSTGELRVLVTSDVVAVVTP